MIRFLRDRGAHRRLAAAVASGLMLALAFPPWDLGPLALVALVPLLWAWRGATPWRAAGYGFVFGFTFFAVLMGWLVHFGTLPIILLPAACAAYTAFTGVLVAQFERLGVRSPWIAGAAWLALETLRGRWPLGGLPWGEIGAALHDVAAARALASWGGVALVSFLVVVVNALLLDLVLALRARSRRFVAFAAAGVAMVFVVTALVETTRFHPTESGHLRVALLQGNDQNRDIQVRSPEFSIITENHFQLAATLHGHYDLIVFPESALYNDPQADAALRARLLQVGRAHGADILANAAVEIPGPDDRAYNANRLYETNGTLQGTYAKEHLVPFGEYLPWRRYLTWVHATAQIGRDYKPGTERVLFHVKGHVLGTVICFESAFAPLVRDYVREGAEVIIVTTNNRSYQRSGNSAQHLALSQMRAAETGRPVLHASISGITGVIDADGDVLEMTRLFRNQVVTATVTTETGETPFVRFGEWAVWASGVGLVVTAAVARVRQARRRRAATATAGPDAVEAFPRLAEPAGTGARRTS
jgi:apolipoprotein N-acyltransferase